MKNNDFNHFDYVPTTIGRDRSTFKYHKTITTGANVGFLYPICKPINMLPGSTIDLKSIVAEVISDSLIRPLFQELKMDVFAFAVPNRIVWEHWKQYLGSTDDVLFDNLSSYTKPYIMFKYGSTGLNNGLRVQHSLAACFELPAIPSTGTARKISALEFRGYNFIWNQYFRPEQLVNPILFSKGDRGNAGDNVSCAIPAVPNFSIAGNNVTIPVPGRLLDTAGVNDTCDGGCVLPVYRVHKTLQTSCLPAPSLETINLFSSVEGAPSFEYTDTRITPQGTFGTSSGSTNAVTMRAAYDPDSPEDTTFDWSEVVLTVNNYRENIMLQNYYDVLNRAGSRYGEIMYNIFGTRPASAVIDIPELIIHKRFSIFRNKVVATAETTNDGDTTSVGSQHANIDTIVRDSFFRYTSLEHCLVHLCYAIRPVDVVQADGIEPLWKVLEKLDEYYPQFDGMGDIPIYKDSIRAASSQSAIFGYNEYGAEYKIQRNSATGWCNPNISGYVAGYTLAEKLTGDPELKADLWSYCSCIYDMSAFGACLAVTNPEIAPQFIVHFRLDGTITHPMPVYNIPGDGALL